MTPRVRNLLLVAGLVMVAATAGFAGGFAGSYFHPGPPGPQGVQGITGPSGPQGVQGLSADLGGYTCYSQAYSPQYDTKTGQALCFLGRPTR
jgi:hypothetical protein